MDEYIGLDVSLKETAVSIRRELPVRVLCRSLTQ